MNYIEAIELRPGCHPQNINIGQPQRILRVVPEEIKAPTTPAPVEPRPEPVPAKQDA